MTDAGWWLDAAAAITAFSAPVVQVAADGAWETALVLDRQDAGLAADLVAGAVNGALRDIAVEVLWSGEGFVGARWNMEEAEEAVAAVGRVAAQRPRHPALLLGQRAPTPSMTPLPTTAPREPVSSPDEGCGGR